MYTKKKCRIKQMMAILLSVVMLICMFPASAMAAETSNFPVKYLEGCDDIVANMPAEGTAQPGGVYEVSTVTPEREGYEFIEWILEWEERVPATTTSYVVHYVDADGNSIAEDKTVTDLEVGSTITESAIEIERYRAQDPTEQNITLTEGTNEITFVYDRTYRVIYDAGIGSGVFEAPVDTREYLPGETVDLLDLNRYEEVRIDLNHGCRSYNTIFFAWYSERLDYILYNLPANSTMCRNCVRPEPEGYWEFYDEVFLEGTLIMPEHDVILYATYRGVFD